MRKVKLYVQGSTIVSSQRIANSYSFFFTHLTPEVTTHVRSLSLSLSLSLSHLVVANILPPTFSLAQSCLEQASGEGKVDVCRSTKSIGSASRHVGQRALSVL